MILRYLAIVVLLAALGGCGFMLWAYSREQVDQIFDLPRLNRVNKVIDNFEEDDYVQQCKARGAIVEYDVDNPPPHIEEKIIANQVFVSGEDPEIHGHER